MQVTQDIRSYMKLFEADRPGDNRSDMFYQEVPNEKGDITKVIATLSSFASGKYSRLAKNIQQMQKIAEETLQLEKEIKQDGREAIADLFAAEDAAYTRVVETVSFTLQITKDPKAATTIKYVNVLEELETHLTPELIVILEKIKAKFSTVQKPKPPSLTHQAKIGGVGYDESITEGPLLNLGKGWLRTFRYKINQWGRNYDRKLGNLKSQLMMHEGESNISESLTTPSNVMGALWEAVNNSQTDMLETLGERPNGASMTVRSGGGVFEVSVRQVS